MRVRGAKKVLFPRQTKLGVKKRTPKRDSLTLSRKKDLEREPDQDMLPRERKREGFGRTSTAMLVCPPCPHS